MGSSLVDVTQTKLLLTPGEAGSVKRQARSQLGPLADKEKMRKVKGKLSNVPSVHFRSLSGRVTKPLPQNYFRSVAKEDLEAYHREMKKEKMFGDLVKNEAYIPFELAEFGLVDGGDGPEAADRGKI